MGWFTTCVHISFSFGVTACLSLIKMVDSVELHLGVMGSWVWTWRLTDTGRNATVQERDTVPSLEKLDQSRRHLRKSYNIPYVIFVETYEKVPHRAVEIIQGET